MKKLFSFVLPILFLFFILSPVLAEKKNVLFFYSITCPHCVEEEKFLDKMKDKYPELKIESYEVSKNYNNANYLREIGGALGINVSGVPVLVLGKDSVVGYQDESTTGAEIESLIRKYYEINQTKKPEKFFNKINIPFFGEKDVRSFSLPILTIIVGALDGFNPCAMWVLVFLITLLLGMKDRKKMWILGGAFIFTSGFVYFLFLAAWLNLFLFIGFITAVRICIGLVALGSGIYHVREYFVNKEAACKVTKGDKQQKTFSRLKEIVANDNLIIALVGIVLLAGAVNLVELVCSAGFPAVYTNVLSLANLPAWKHYGYLLLYILFFMLDDMFIFFIAMITLKMTFINVKYTRYSNIIGGILMLIIGILLIFKPTWIMFA